MPPKSSPSATDKAPTSDRSKTRTRRRVKVGAGSVESSGGSSSNVDDVVVDDSTVEAEPASDESIAPELADEVELLEDALPSRALRVPVEAASRSADGHLWPALAIGLGVLVATIAGGYLLAAQGPDVWAADSEVRIRIAPEIAFADADRLLQTERLRVESFGLLEPVADELNTSVDDLREAVSAEPILGSEVLSIRAESRNAERALEINAAVTSAFVTAINESDLALGSAKLESQRADLEADFAAAAERFEAAEAAYVADRADLPEERRDEVTRSKLELATTELDRVSGQLRDITSEQRQLDIRNSTTRGADVITPSYVLRDPVAPTPVRGAAAGALIGLVIAAAIVAVLTRTGRPTTPR